jgi:integrase
MTATRHRNGGLRKRCACPRRVWAKCSHGWHINFKWKDVHYRLSLDREAGRPITSKSDAQAEAERIRNAIREGRFRPHEGETTCIPLSFSQFADIYVDEHVKKFCKTSALRNVPSQRKRIEPVLVPSDTGKLMPLGEKSVASITTRDLEILDGALMAVSPQRRNSTGGRTSRNRIMQFLKAMFNWAVAKGYRSDTPFRRGTVNVIPLFKEFPRNRRLTGDEEPRLLGACGPRLHALVIALLETACRVGELLNLQWKQIRWLHNEIYLPGPAVKGQRDRFVPMSQRLRAALEMLRHRPDGREFGPEAFVFGTETGKQIKSIKTAWRLACRRAGIEGLSIHDLRREAASSLHESGMPLAYVSQFLGHAQLTTTSRYIQASRLGMQEWVKRVEQTRNAQRGAVAQPLHTGGKAQEARDGKSFQFNNIPQ